MANRSPRIYAHRGSTLLAPENTLLAFDRALSMGADVLETDVRLCADNHVIVTHDADVRRTTNGAGKVRSLSVAELRELDAGYRARSLSGERFNDQGIQLITLDELFESYPETAINIDIKDSFFPAADAVAQCIDRHQRAHNTTVGSFHTELLLYFRSKAPSVRTAAVRSEVARLYFNNLALPMDGITSLRRQRQWDQSVDVDASCGDNPTLRQDYAALQIPVSYKMIPLATRRFISRAKAANIEICYWTINNAAQMRKLLKLGADGIVTDRPDLADQVFRELGIR